MALTQAIPAGGGLGDVVNDELLVRLAEVFAVFVDNSLSLRHLDHHKPVGLEEPPATVALSFCFHGAPASISNALSTRKACAIVPGFTLTPFRKARSDS